LLAQTLGRLYSSAYYALRDTRTPLRFAVIRVVLTTGLGYLCALPLHFGVPGLTASAGVAGWVEFTLLRRTLNRRVGPTGIDRGLVARLWAAALLAAGGGWAVKLALGDGHRLAGGLVVLAVYGTIYFALTWMLGVKESRDLLKRLQR
jgi:putative peptidoglycan lipid II flippase